MKRSERESDIQSAICDYLAYGKVFFWRSNNIPVFNRNGDGSIQMRRLPKYTMKGLPDIIIVKDGQFVGLEIKRPGTYQSPEQKAFQAQAEEAGARYAVVRSIEDVQRLGALSLSSPPGTFAASPRLSPITPRWAVNGGK